MRIEKFICTRSIIPGAVDRAVGFNPRAKNRADKKGNRKNEGDPILEIGPNEVLFEAQHINSNSIVLFEALLDEERDKEVLQINLMKQASSLNGENEC